MTTPHDIFQELIGRSFKVHELKEILSVIRVKYQRALPAEVGVRELLDIAHKNHWLKEETDGHLTVIDI